MKVFFPAKWKIVEHLSSVARFCWPGEMMLDLPTRKDGTRRMDFLFFSRVDRVSTGPAANVCYTELRACFVHGTHMTRCWTFWLMATIASRVKKL